LFLLHIFSAVFSNIVVSNKCNKLCCTHSGRCSFKIEVSSSQKGQADLLFNVALLVQDANSDLSTVSCTELALISLPVNTRVLVSELLDYKEEENRLP
jgi:hypothetical protein